MQGLVIRYPASAEASSCGGVLGAASSNTGGLYCLVAQAGLAEVFELVGCQFHRSPGAVEN
jgi:hypothetical protein